MEERLARVEEGIKKAAEDLGDIKHALKDIASSLSKLAVLEEKHNNVAEALKRAFNSIEKNEARIDAIEKALPNLVLASSWVFKATLCVMGLLGASALAVVVKALAEK